MRILGVSGSLQSRSGNRALLDAARACARDGVEVVIFEGLREIPPFDPDQDAAGAPDAVVAWRRALAGSDAVLVASPEYGFSLPGSLKNAIDWAIGSGELEGKVVGLTAAVNVEGRGRRGLEALADTLRAVSARIVGGSGIVRGPSFERDVGALVSALITEAQHPEQPPDHGMGMLRPSALVAAWVDAFNRADSDALAAFYAADAVNHQVAESPASGRDAIRAMFAQGFATAKMHCIVENVFEDGDWAILEWRDPLGLRGCGFFQVKQGLIVFQRGYWDKLSFLRQQGLPLPRE
ncbi:MAG TPA: NAD(P)H-dependent oxidoreductase [Polyangiaceae bacterium]